MSPLLAVILIAVAAGTALLAAMLARGGGCRTVLLWPSPDEAEDGERT